MLISSAHKHVLLNRLNISRDELDQYPGLSYYQKSSWALMEALPAFSYDEIIDILDIPYGTELTLDLERLIILLRIDYKNGVVVATEKEIQEMMKKQAEADRAHMEMVKGMLDENQDTV